MSALLDRPVAPSPVRAPVAVVRLGRAPWWLLLGGLAFAVRALGLGTANDVFIDEVTYASLADQVASGHLPSTAGEPFFLHPPASFVLNALVIKIVGVHGDAMDLALQLRWVNAVLGSITVVLVFLLVRRLAGRWVGPAAALVLAFDPFVLRLDGRLMIEPVAGLGVVAGWLLLVRALQDDPERPRVWPAGLAFGLALVSKDMTAVFTVLPLLVAVLWRRTVSWTTVRRMLPTLVLPYLCWLVVVTVAGLAPAFAEQKATGFLRMIGVIQETGFNSAPNADLVGRLVEMVTRFGTSYVLLALCPVVGLVAALSADRVRRLVGLMALAAGLLGAYCVVGGAAEEQFGYYVVLAAVIATPVAVLELIARWSRLRVPLITAAVLFGLAGGFLGVHARTTQDDGLVEARAYLDQLPAGSEVALTSVTGEFALLPHQDWTVAPSLASLDATGARYVLTQSYPLSQGYGYSDPKLLDWLAAHATPVFTTTGPTSGDTTVWRLDRAALDEAVASGTTLPPVSGGYQ